jgi:hypothetical protein
MKRFFQQMMKLNPVLQSHSFTAIMPYVKDAVASPCHMFFLLNRIAMQYLFRNIA